MNTKTKLTLLAGPLALGLCACGGQNNYLPDPVDSNWTAYQQVIVAHPGMECVMVWGPGVYQYPCYPMGTTIPYSVHVYYPRTGYCGCWHTAARPTNYKPVYVNKTTYNKTVINNTTVVNNNSNNKTTTNNKPTSPPKTGSTTSLNKGSSRSTGTSGRR